MNKTPILFIKLSLLALLLGAGFGTLAGIQYIYPEFLKELIAFNKMRPFHVTTVIGWIILCATGGIYYYLINELKFKLYSNKLLKTHFLIFVVCALAIYISFASGKMGGREYLTYFPLISIPIIIGWVLFGINYFKTTTGKIKNGPVYLWMWATGIVFMIYHFSEAHLWLIPHFRENFVRDISVQWKSYGSFVGSWNMLVYGTAIFLMSRIKKDDSLAYGKKVFFFYFLGLTNLMFGWAHHTYIIPTQPWVRFVAYFISMTEWVVLFNIIWEWKKSLGKNQKQQHSFSYKFLMATDFWVAINLLMALLISIPFINFFTHGTHITVAHSMGTTIGINTTILLASVAYIGSKNNIEIINKYTKSISYGFWALNYSLFVFLGCLYTSGIKKSIWMYFTDSFVSFGEMQQSIHPVMKLFLISGFGILISLSMIVYPLYQSLITKKSNSERPTVFTPKEAIAESSDL